MNPNRAELSRRSALKIGVAAGLSPLIGCGGTEGPGVGPEPSGKPKLALVMKSLANEFFSNMAEGARRHQAEHASDYDLIINGIKDERDLGRQVALVDEMIAQGARALVIAPADSKALVSACKRAQEAGLKVVNIDNKLDAGVQAAQGVSIPFVGPDNRAGARLAGDYLAKRLKAGDEVAILEGIRTAFNGQQRLLGFQDAITAADLKLVDSQSAQWEMDQANKIALAILGERPEIRALLCCNDSMALGALAALKAVDRVGKVLIVGFDNVKAVGTAIRDGSILATVDQHGDQLAVFGIEHALEMLRGNESVGDRSTPVDLITAETKD